jgi:hypothetical protein
MLNDKEKSLVKLSMNKEWTNPKYKLKWFVGQAQITPFAKFRQWLLEIKSKEESIENMEYELAKLDVEYDRYKRMRDQASDPLDKRLAEIEMWNTDRLRYTSKRRLQDWYLERQHLIDLLQEFMESEESKLPDGSGRTYMDIIDTEEEDLYEHEYWTNRLAKQAACDMLFYGRINSGNMDAILSMSSEQQAETLALTVNFSTQLQQYQLKLQSDAESALKNKLEMDNKALLTPSEVKYVQDNMPLYDKSIKNVDQEEMLNVYTIRNDSQ